MLALVRIVLCRILRVLLVTIELADYPCVTRNYKPKDGCRE